ncbi:MAG: lipoate--protein ligase family protein [Erysipelotrichaceae bacterium]
MNHYVYFSHSVDPHYNLALEEYLLDHMPADAQVLLLWQNEPSVIIGQNQDAASEVHLDLLRQDHVHLVRRSSGGGAVYQDLGNLNFSFLMPTATYDLDTQFSIIIAALARFGIQAQRSGRNDLCVQERKVSGNAFLKRKHHQLHHGTLLVEVDFARLQAYLHVHPLKLQSKKVTSVVSRVANLSEFAPISVVALQQALVECYEQVFQSVLHPFDLHLDVQVFGTYLDKYADPSRTLAHFAALHEQEWMSALGYVHVRYYTHALGGVALQLNSDALVPMLKEQMEQALQSKKPHDALVALGFHDEDALRILGGVHQCMTL